MARYVKKECECGLDISRGQFKRHQKGKQHTRRMNRLSRDITRLKVSNEKHTISREEEKELKTFFRLPPDLLEVIARTQDMANEYNKLPSWARSLFWETAKRSNGSEHKDQ